MLNWDYNLPENWKPKTEDEWVWYIERVVNYGPRENDKLDRGMVKKYFDRLKLDKERKAYLSFLLHGE